MIQIAIIGIAFMLIIKGLDVYHQQRLAVAAGNDGSPILAAVTIILSLLFAISLVGMASEQGNHIPSAPSFGGN